MNKKISFLLCIVSSLLLLTACTPKSDRTTSNISSWNKNIPATIDPIFKKWDSKSLIKSEGFTNLTGSIQRQ